MAPIPHPLHLPFFCLCVGIFAVACASEICAPTTPPFCLPPICCHLGLPTFVSKCFAVAALAATVAAVASQFAHAMPRPRLSACTRLTAQFPNFNNYIRCMLQLTDCIGIDNGNGNGPRTATDSRPGSGWRSSAIFCHIFCGRYLHLVRVAAVAVAAAIAVAATKLICANCANCLRDKFMFANFN